jgi:hypothetical protein
MGAAEIRTREEGWSELKYRGRDPADLVSSTHS